MPEQLSQNAINVYQKLYLNRGQNNEIIETIQECHHRIAGFLGTTNNEENEFREILNLNTFRPNTPVFCNAGITSDPLLSACFITGLDDSMQGIIELWANAATIFAGGGGIGIPLSKLREKGAIIKNGGQASGPIAYLKVIETISETVKSGGKNRRAATLTSFDYKHPDIMEYITCKTDKKSFNSINTSVLLDNTFMNHIIDGCTDNSYTPVSPNSNSELHSDICYQDVWDALVEQAHATGDPGLLFYDQINKWNPLQSLGDITCSNPCGEVVGFDYFCCNLGHINLNKIIEIENDVWKINWTKFKQYVQIAVRFLNRIIDTSTYPHPKFKEMMMKTRPIGLGIMGFSDILFKLEIPYTSQNARDLLSDITKFMTKEAFRASIQMAKKEGRCIEIPVADEEHFINILREHDVFMGSPTILKSFMTHGIMNCTVTTIAPTGSTAISADASYSFEPCFALAFGKNVSDSEETWSFINPVFYEYCLKNISEPFNDILEQIDANHGSIKGLDHIFNKKEQELFCVAHDINWDDRLKMQAAAQEHITMSISSTVNLPNSATREDIASVYKRAYTLDLKGITVYRDGCKENQPVQFSKPDIIKKYSQKLDTEELHQKLIKEHEDAIAMNIEFNHIKFLGKSPKETREWLNMWSSPEKENPFYNMCKEAMKPKKWIITGITEEKAEEIIKEFKYEPGSIICLKPGEHLDIKPMTEVLGAIERPMVRAGKTVEVSTSHGKMYVTGNWIENKLAEVFISMGNQGDFENTLLDTIGRLLSKSLQHRVPLTVLTDTMRGVGGEIQWVQIKEDEEKSRQLNGVIDILANILDEHFEKITVVRTKTGINTSNRKDWNTFSEFGNVEKKTISDELVNTLRDNPPKKMSGTDLESMIQQRTGYERCPDCERFSLARTSGCRGGTCHVCGYSKCS